MKYSREELRQRVIDAVALALDRRPAGVRMHSSLIDDLGAESIDFLDIRFRIESEFGLKISDDEMWQGELLPGHPELVTERGVSDQGLRLLQERMPEFRWERFPNGITAADLPRLITPETIVAYLEKRLL
jgi:acyl carrier protein